MNDFICTCGPGDHDAEEHSSTSGVALLLSGSFVARDRHGTSLLSEGSLFLVEAGHCFVCSHRHGEGDRCLSFQFAPEVFERIAHDAGAKPALRAQPPAAAARACRTSPRAPASRWRSRTRWRRSRSSLPAPRCGSPAATAAARPSAQHHGRMTEVLRYMAEHAAAPHKLAGLARMARMSPYHFLRSFKATTGVTPHQWLLRARLRRRPRSSRRRRAPVTEIALDVGFEDLSNFTRTFRAEFGASPRQYRLAA